MQNESPHLDDSLLRSLILEDDSCNANSDILAHVESCDDCRERLDALSGSESFDSETRKMLAGFFNGDSSVDFHEQSPAESAIVSCLAPPSHPEMLGRLGRYEIECVIGSGGMGVVFKGFDTELNRPVAIKVLAQHLSYSGAARRRFEREAKAAAAVVHEHVVAIHNVETEGDTPFLVMSYVAGESLQSRVEREGPLDVKEALRIGAQVAAGLQAAHDQGVVHRDIKPGNILLERGVERALVTDFGLAQTIDEASLTQTGIVAGTPHYMSPEQAIGKPTDPRSDLFSLGSVLYFMVTGKPPFCADKAMGVLNRICHEPHSPVWQDYPEISDELSDVVDRLLEKKPAHRFANAGQVQTALQTLLANLQNHKPRHLVAAKRFMRWHRKSIRIAGWVAGICAIMFLGALLFSNQATRSSPNVSKESQTQQPVEAEAKSESESKSEPTSFSVAIWQQASPTEAQQWAARIHEMEGSLSRLEQSSQGNAWHSELASQVQWEQELLSLDALLDRYQNK